MAEPRPLNLALQGGGAHGAFAWGILDRLLEDGRFRFDGIAATSAGAMNAVAVAQGLMDGGPEGARAELAGFWQAVSEAGRLYSPIRRLPWETAQGWQFEPPASFALFDAFTRVVSPYQFNPLNLNPLRELLDETVDFEALQKDPSLKLLVSTTKVSDGTLRIFREDDLTLDAVLASACLPLIHQAVEIDGESYWDGGFAANPPLLPLVEASDVNRVLLIQLIPTSGDDHPTTSPSIVNRLNQITFNNALQRDLETIAALQRLSEEERGRTDAARKLKALTIDHVSAEDWYPDLNHQSALNLKPSFLTGLRDAGREAAGAWLGEEAKAEMPAEEAAKAAS